PLSLHAYTLLLRVHYPPHPATYTLSLHDALPIYYNQHREKYKELGEKILYTGTIDSFYDYCYGKLEYRSLRFETEILDEEKSSGDRKSTRLNSSHVSISYAVFCVKKKKKTKANEE